MAKVRLNERAIRRPAPEAGQVELWDDLTVGFGLRIAAGGARTYFVMRRLNGKLVRRTVGKAPRPDVPNGAPLADGVYWPAEARKRAKVMLAALMDGVDPEPASPARATAASAPQTFGEVAAAYFKDPSPQGGAKLSSRKEEERKVRVDLAGWVNRPAGGITREDIEAVVDAKAAAAGVSANRLLARIKRIFRWAARRKYVPFNPAADVDKPTIEESRKRVLSLHELARLWAAAEAMGYPYGPLLQMLILTAQRRNEVAELPWAEIDGDVWTLPGERAKNKVEHLVPLSPRARAILKSLPRLGSSTELVFTTGRRKGKDAKGNPLPPAPVSGWSRMKTRLDKKIATAIAMEADEPLDLERHALPHWTPHDIRRSVSTHLRSSKVMGDNRIDKATLKMILNHKDGGVTDIYDHYDGFAEKQAALEAWALVIERLCGLNVVSLDEARA